VSRKRKSRKKTPVSSKPELGRKNTWAFRIVSLVLMPLLLFGVLEVGLRLVGFGYPVEALIERDFNGKRMCFPNAQFSWRFFPHQLARQFERYGFTFEKRKAPGTFRIFVLGGSAALGTPNSMFSFGRILEAMLGEMYPNIDFEVHNVAMTAINSHVVREIAKDCAAYDPDLFIVYLGNNEVVGPFGPGTVFTSMPPSLPLIRANIAVKSTRTGQLFESLMGMITSHGRAPKSWGGMRMFLDNQVRPDSRALESVYRNYEENLQDICRVAQHSGAAVIVSDVGANLRDCPPFGSLHREGLSNSDKGKWEEIYQEGVELEAEGSYAEAIERYLAAAAIDDTYAELQFRMGRCYWETGDYEKARLHYQLARQDDTLRFRADARINNIIRKTAEGRADEGIYYADSVAAFEASSPHQIPGSELFYEHVHLNFHGNYLLARTIVPFVEPLLPPMATPRGELMTEEQVARRIAYTEYDEYKDLMSVYENALRKPPFTNQLYHDDSMNKMKAVVDRLRDSVDLQKCMEQYNQAVRENPEDWRLLVRQYQMTYAIAGDSNLGIQEGLLRQIATLHPYDGVFNSLGNVLMLQGRYNDAEDALNRSLLINPASDKAYLSLTDLSLKRNDRASAIRYLRRVIELAPAGSILPHRLLATQYDNAGKTDQGIQVLQQALEIFSEDQAAPVHFHLGELLNKQGKREEALEQMETALRISPELAKDDTFVFQYNLIKGN